jgi:5-methylcytosine-specific restriction endonuclease McrA
MARWRRFPKQQRIRQKNEADLEGPSVKRLTAELEKTRRLMQSSEESLATTRVALGEVRAVAAEIGVEDLLDFFNETRAEYYIAHTPPPNCLVSFGDLPLISRRRAPEAELISPERCFGPPDLTKMFREYTSAFANELKEALRREDETVRQKASGQPFWRRVFDHSGRDALRPIRCGISVVENALKSTECFFTSFPSLLPCQLDQHFEYHYCDASISIRFTNFVGRNFADTWNSKFQSLAEQHNRLIDGFKKGSFPKILTVLSAARDHRLSHLPMISRSSVQIREFEARVTEWLSCTESPVFVPENWESGWLRRRELIPWFGDWPFPRKATWNTERTLKKRIRQYRSAALDLETRIAARVQNESAETLLKKVRALETQIDEHAIEKAAAAAHWGDIRKTAPAVRTRIEAEVSDGSPCPYCSGDIGPDWQADHIYPVKLGGLSTIENMVAVCFQCNSRKSDKTLREFSDMQQFDYDQIVGRLRAIGRRC